MLKYFSWQWVLSLVVEWAAKNLTEEMVQEWVDDLKAVAIPWTRNKFTELVAALRVKAGATDNPLDDVVVDAVEKLINALLPDNPEVV